jgi:hypothetical protein
MYVDNDRYLSPFELTTNVLFILGAGKSSDISYYLNSHHIDFHVWSLYERARPCCVTALSSTGVAKSQYNIDTEDVITLSVQWMNLQSKTTGTAVYTSSWISAKSDTHTQQKFFYVGHHGEINIDQAHRGYTLASDSTGYASINPLYMKLVPTDGNHGKFYRSLMIYSLLSRLFLWSTWLWLSKFWSFHWCCRWFERATNRYEILRSNLGNHWHNPPRNSCFRSRSH